MKKEEKKKCQSTSIAANLIRNRKKRGHLEVPGFETRRQIIQMLLKQQDHEYPELYHLSQTQ